MADTPEIANDEVDDDGETLTLSLRNASGATIADAKATGTIWSTQTREPEAEPLTAEFTNVPEAHDGQDAFTGA